MGVDGDASPPREFDEFETGIEEMLQHLVRRDANEQRWTIDQTTKVRLESATQGPPARATFRLFVTPAMTNALNNLHGGCAATIIDILTVIPVMAVGKPGVFQYGGVSRNLNVTYLRPVPVHTEIRVVCEVTQIGKRLSLLRAEIRRVDDDALCVLSEHQKANTDPPADPKL
ncbi:hypothetical protein TMatcc_001041 [Talaromyces marneffei ATCC 18224]|uniref:Thioesterase family protein, putative n=1 Tax=Talaromyces marneffei (strain ATCC 18224 / CBS 334.59 / QM 7333) TaxID=441960 RepID=B6QRM9_TALMQ|nr:uncharacterized protein EYB26_003564 [Talaromyces marneffei]EEA21035.1 thioesterase family protein, putative [Talaromyces marneffei ATCC 18224]KAE8549977.1 hypothetical protein EYB25_008502 [Talaromyces marneffei]QGA15903.1 hypothetical protein EYB26_003564 [Talaromyces marneffei]